MRLAYGPRGLFEVQKLKQQEGKRDAVGTKKARDKLGMNVGAGPVLDICEDLGWFKEGRGEDGMRVNVYGDVVVKAEDWAAVKER